MGYICNGDGNCFLMVSDEYIKIDTCYCKKNCVLIQCSECSKMIPEFVFQKYSKCINCVTRYGFSYDESIICDNCGEYTDGFISKTQKLCIKCINI